MITIFNEQDAKAITDTDLAELVRSRLALAKETGLEELTCVAVIETGDTEDLFITQLGFSPLENPVSETRFGDRDFMPAWAWLAEHPGWYEVIFTVGNDGFAFILFVSKTMAPWKEFPTACRMNLAG